MTKNDDLITIFDVTLSSGAWFGITVGAISVTALLLSIIWDKNL